MATRYATQKDSIFTLTACESGPGDCPGNGVQTIEGIHQHFLREYTIGATKTHRRDTDGNIIMAGTGPDKKPLLVDAGLTHERACIEFDSLYREHLATVAARAIPAVPVSPFDSQPIETD